MTPGRHKHNIEYFEVTFQEDVEFLDIKASSTTNNIWSLWLKDQDYAKTTVTAIQRYVKEKGKPRKIIHDGHEIFTGETGNLLRAWAKKNGIEITQTLPECFETDTPHGFLFTRYERLT